MISSERLIAMFPMASSIRAWFTFKVGEFGFKVEIEEAKDRMDIIFPEGIQEASQDAKKLRSSVMDAIREHAANDDFDNDSFW